MTDKQIIIDYENRCENYSKEVGCYNTFDGSCIKEQCFTYRLLQLLKAKEQECEELNKKLQAQRAFTAQEQCKIYCVAYDKTCETGNECKQKKCVFKDRLKYKQALDEIEKYLDAQQKYFDGEYYHNLLDIINKIKGENNNV